MTKRFATPARGGHGILATAAIVTLLVGSPALQYQLALVCIFAVAALGQQWLLGRTGQISVGTAALMGAGAFTCAKVASHGWAPFPIPLILAGLVAGAVGLLIGLTSLRLRGIYLLLSTLALQYIVSFVLQTSEGISAGTVIAPPHIGGWTISLGRGFDIVLVVTVLLIALMLYNLYRAPGGRAWSAIRQSDTAAAVAGINTTRWKFFAFIGSSAITGVAGGLYAYQLQFISYQTFSLDLAISVLVMVYIGGQRSLAGAILGAAIVTLLTYVLGQLQNWVGGGSSGWFATNGAILDNAVYGVGLVLVIVFQRDGIAGMLSSLETRIRRARRRRSQPPSESHLSTGGQRDVAIETGELTS